MVETAEPMDEVVRRARVLVIEEKHSVASVAQLLGLGRTALHHMLTGKSYRNAGGPIREPQPRVKGIRRICSRCRARGNDEWFAVLRDARTGICGKCVRPEDYEIHAEVTRRRERTATTRKMIQDEIKRLSQPPWGKSLLSAADRAELHEKTAEIKRAIAVCGAPWARPRRGAM